MLLAVAAQALLIVAAVPFIYYLIAIYSSWRFFRHSNQRPDQCRPAADFTPPVSNLKPARGLDPEAYENFASFCRQDYPEYELVFCVDENDATVVPVIEKLKRDFPERRIRVLFGSAGSGSNDKVAKLDRLVNEAAFEHVVITDSDVRVQPDYLRTVVAPLANPRVGAVTCFYVSTGEKTFAETLQTLGMVSDFFPSIVVAWQLEGVKFTLGPTIATTRTRLAEFGGYAAIEDRPGDDLLIGRLIAEQGYKVALLPYAVEAVSDYGSIRQLLDKRLRWIVVMRHMRPWGHFGLLFTQGFAWSLAAVAIHPSVTVAVTYFGLYLALRFVMTWMVGVRGLKHRDLIAKLPMILVWDAIAFVLWLASFLRNSIRWRGSEYYIRDGRLVPVAGNMSAD